MLPLIHRVKLLDIINKVLSAQCIVESQLILSIAILVNPFHKSGQFPYSHEKSSLKIAVTTILGNKHGHMKLSPPSILPGLSSVGFSYFSRNSSTSVRLLTS